MKTINKLWIWVAALAVISPLGLLLPEYFKSGEAWGEWSAEKIEKLAGYVPAGIKKLGSIWKAPVPDYALKGWEEKGLPHLSLAYIISALLGIGAVVAVMFLLGKMLTRKKD